MNLADTTSADWIGEICYLDAPSGRSEMIAKVREHWAGVCGARRFPKRGEIDPTAIYNSLPYLSIMQYQHEPYRVQFRLVGNEVSRLYGGNVNGRWLDEMNWDPQDLTDTGHIYERLYRMGTPLYGLSYTNFQSKADRVFEWAAFPLSEDGKRVTHALSIDDYTMVAPRTGRPF